MFEKDSHGWYSKKNHNTILKTHTHKNSLYKMTPSHPTSMCHFLL